MAENWKKLARGLGYESETEMWQDLYVDQGLSIPQLADRLSYGTHTIRRRLMLCSIERRPVGGPRIMTYQREKLFHLDQRAVWSMSAVDLSQVTGISAAVIYKYKRYAKGDVDGILCDLPVSGVGEICDPVEETPSSGPCSRSDV